MRLTVCTVAGAKYSSTMHSQIMPQTSTGCLCTFYYEDLMQCRASSSPERSRSANRGSRASSTSSSSERRQAHSARLYVVAHGYQPHTLEEFRAQGYDAKRERYWTLGMLGADVDTEELQVTFCCTIILVLTRRRGEISACVILNRLRKTYSHGHANILSWSLVITHLLMNDLSGSTPSRKPCSSALSHTCAWHNAEKTGEGGADQAPLSEH